MKKLAFSLTLLFSVFIPAGGQPTPQPQAAPDTTRQILRRERDSRAVSETFRNPAGAKPGERTPARNIKLGKR